LHPFLFSDILGAVLAVSLGLSVLLRERNRHLPLQFFLFTAGVGGLFALAALKMPPDGTALWPARVLLSIATGWLGIRFFFLFMHGQRRFPHWKGPLAITLFVLTLAGAFAAGFPQAPDAWQLRVLEGVFLAYCAGWVLADMQALSRRTTYRAALGRIQLLLVATALLVLVFPATRIWNAGSPVWHATGNAAVLLYLYFLSQTIMHQRLLDLDEMLTRLAVLAALVAGITAIYLGMLSWIPDGDRDLFRLNVVSASMIVVLLLDPLSQFAERWIFRTLFFRRKELERLLRDLSRRLDVLPASENAAADLVLERLMESRRVATACLYVVSPRQPDLVRLGAVGRDFPLFGTQGSWGQLWERLQVEDMVTREDVELELERLHRGWLAPRAPFEAQAVLRVLDELAADACFPIHAHEKLYGFLAVGDAARKNPYAKSELSEFFNLSQKIGAVFTSLDRQNLMRRQEHLAALGQLAAGLAHEDASPAGVDRHAGRREAGAARRSGDRQHGPGQAAPDPAQPRAQRQGRAHGWRRRDAGRGGSDADPASRGPPPRRGRPRGHRRRLRHPGRTTGPRVRAVLHHQGPRHGPGPADLRPAHGVRRGRAGHHLGRLGHHLHAVLALRRGPRALIGLESAQNCLLKNSRGHSMGVTMDSDS